MTDPTAYITSTDAGVSDTAIDTASIGTGAVGGGQLLGLEASNVSAWFSGHKVLERVSLHMEAGRVTALIGPSGCGKSTFLRILNRMHEMVKGAQLAGQVLLAGHDIYDPVVRPAEVRRRIGMVFQKPNPFPAMSIYDNVASGLKLSGIKTADTADIVETSLRRAGLWTEVQRRLRSPGGALSGGQQQRLCIARSLAIAPDVLLMDEPCSALDPTSTNKIEETIAELADQVTIVIVTHNMQQAQRVSDNCAFFLATHDTPGYIVESGPTGGYLPGHRGIRARPTTSTAGLARPVTGTHRRQHPRRCAILATHTCIGCRGPEPARDIVVRSSTALRRRRR